MRPTLRFTAAGTLTLAYVAFAIWFSDPWASRPWGWQSCADIFAPTVREFGSLAPRLPAMIAETGSAPDPRKADWVADTLRSARADGIAAVVWFEFAKETDWRLSEDPAAAAAARAVVGGRGRRQGGDLAAIERAVAR
jgi:hypothetical protein